jgi:site-specific recombinase XerD
LPRRSGNHKSRKRTKRASTDRLPSKETLSRIVRMCSSKTRAAVLLLASSGIRVGELVRLKVADLDLSQHPPAIRIKDAMRPRRWRITYITIEAAGAVQSYLAERRNRGERIDKDTPVFAYESGASMTPQAMASMIRRAFDAAGFGGQRIRLESQVLRRWFKRQLIGSGAPRKIVDFLCGHVRRPRPREEEVKHWYSKAIPFLTITGPTPSHA